MVERKFSPQSPPITSWGSETLPGSKPAFTGRAQLYPKQAEPQSSSPVFSLPTASSLVWISFKLISSFSLLNSNVSVVSLEMNGKEE